MIPDLKASFMLNEVWMLTINAAFQRANVYEGLYHEKAKAFKTELNEFVVRLAGQYAS